MRDSIQCTIGSPGHLLTRLPALFKAITNPQLGLGFQFARAGLAIMSIGKFMPPPKNQIVLDRDAMIPMRDGVRLCADVLRPAGDGRHPTLLIRHPYGRYLFSWPARQWAQQGYAVVHADERGRFGSEGQWYMFRANAADGRDLCAWIVHQPWSNGQIGGWGSSMLGINQWFLALDNPLVTAIAPNMGCLDVRRLLHFGGAKPLSALALIGNWVAVKKNSPMIDLLAWLPARYPALPLPQIIHPSLGKLDWIEDFLAHDSFDPFFYSLSCQGRYASLCAPSFSLTGWYDMLGDAMIQDFQELRATGTAAARKSRIVIGPWGHYWAPTSSDLDEYIRYSGLETLKWYEHRFQGVKNGVEEWPAVRYYLTGADTWRSSEEWPPRGTQTVSFYLKSQGQAAVSREDGKLLPESPENAQPADAYVYNPADPVPTVGGDHLFFNSGRKEQSKLERRPDVLVYRTLPLAEPLELAGPIRAVLYVSTDAADTDFTAKLLDVCPDGKVWNLRDGIVRLRYREFPSRPMNEPAPVEPGKIYAVTINLGHLAHQFKPGHRLGLHVSSSNFPKFDRNLNTGEDLLTATKMRTARQKVYHDRDHPSCLELTVFSPPGRSACEVSRSRDILKQEKRQG